MKEESNPSISIWEKIDRLAEEMKENQQLQLLECGRRLIPHLTDEDLLQPNDFPELENHPVFRYEEGILAGIQTLQMALRTHAKSSLG